MSPRDAPSTHALRQERPTLVLSPHLDDALLSAAALVLSRPCEVWTVFAGEPDPPRTTSWDTSCGFADSSQTMAARRIEDDAAFAGTPATTRHLPFLDGAYTDREERRQALPALETEIAAWMSAHPGGLVVAPAGAGITVPPAPWQRLTAALRREPGPADAHVAETPAAAEAGPAPAVDDAPRRLPDASGSHVLAAPARRMLSAARSLVGKTLHAEHVRRRRRAMGDDGLAANPDHLAVRDCAFAAATAHPDVTLALFEDLPYLWHARGDDEVARVAAARGVTVQRIVLYVDADDKHARLQHYSSQMPVMDVRGRLVEPGHLPDEEVYWIVSGD